MYYSRTSLLRTPLGPHKASLLKRCPYFRGNLVHFSMYIGGTEDRVLIIEVSLFQRSLIERFHCILYVHVLCKYYVHVEVCILCPYACVLYWCLCVMYIHTSVHVYTVPVPICFTHIYLICWPQLCTVCSL